jgi:osmoprotectant transport system permease protein
VNDFFRWDWAIDHLDDIQVQVVEHLWLTAIAVGIGFALSFPLAILSYRHRFVYGPLLAISGVLYTIPSLALFASLVPFFGLSTLTAEIGLVSYTLLILIRNIVTGLQGVSEDIKDAARGMGYSRWQLLWRVELPLAMPAMVAGLRIATVTTIGLVTVTAIVGMGGLGEMILRGLNIDFSTAIILGAVFSVLLAIVVDIILLIGERMLVPWARRRAAV